MKIELKRIIEETDTFAGRIFDILIQMLIVVSLVTFSIETLPDLNPKIVFLLRCVEVVTVLIFTVEYVLRFFVSGNKLKFVFSFFGLVDLFAILPFYLSFGVDLRAIRAVRLFRIIRILKMARYNKAMDRFIKAYDYAKEEINIFLFFTFILLFLSSVGIYYFEKDVQPEHFKSIFHSLWWSVTTLTTVGYGDVYPVTVGGRIFTFLVLLLGLGVISIPSGLFATAFMQVKKIEKDCSVERGT